MIQNHVPDLHVQRRSPIKGIPNSQSERIFGNYLLDYLFIIFNYIIFHESLSVTFGGYRTLVRLKSDSDCPYVSGLI